MLKSMIMYPKSLFKVKMSLALFLIQKKEFIKWMTTSITLW